MKGCFIAFIVFVSTLSAQAAPPVRNTVQAAKVRQEGYGLGRGAMFY